MIRLLKIAALRSSAAPVIRTFRCQWAWSAAVLLVTASSSFAHHTLILSLVSSMPGQTSTDVVVTDNSEVRIRIACGSLSKVEDKLKSVFDLSPDPKLQKQWKKFKYDILDAYAEGIDETRPIVVDVVFTANQLAYDYRIPLPNSTGEPKVFFEGLRGRGLKIRKLVDQTYEIIETGKKPAHMRIDQNYAWIATGNRSLPEVFLPATADLESMLALNQDLVVEIKNDTKGIASRQSTFRENSERRARIRPNESQFGFELRKALQKSLLNETERLLVEGQQISVNAKIDQPPQNIAARVQFSLTALPDTDLFHMIDEFGMKPSRFANVTLHESFLAASKSCVPLDTIRIQNLTELFHSLRSILVAEIKINLQQKSDRQRDASIRALNTLIDMVCESMELRSIDTFAELFETRPNKHALLCGARIANGQKLDQIITLMPSIRSDWKVKLNATKYADVRIHELIIGKPDLAIFQSVFQDERVAYFGVGTQTVWAAAGDDALKYLKMAIDQAEHPGPREIQSVVASYQIRIGKVLPLLQAIQQQEVSRATPLTRDEKQTRKWIEKRLKLAREAVSGCDSLISGELRKTDHKLEGSIQLNECVMKSLGSLLGNMMLELE